MVQAALSSVLGAFSGQSRREKQARPDIPTSLPAIAAAPDIKRAKLISKQARDERLYSILTQPEVLGFAMALGGLAISNTMPFSGDNDKNNVLQAVASTMSVAMGMGYAGVGDLTSLSVAIAAGAGSLFGNPFDDLGNTNDQFMEWSKLLNPLWMFQSVFS